MHFALFSISFLFALTTFVHSAPTASLDSATLLNNALEAQKLNAQFRSANSTATGSCTNGDTTCVQGAIASCVDGQFTSNGPCPPTQLCLALPSVNSSGTTIACTSKKSAQSLIEAAGATGGITGSGSRSGSSVNPASASSTLSGDTPVTATMNAISPTSTPSNDSVVTVTVTVIQSGTTTLPSVTQTLSPEEASSLLSSLLVQGGPATTDGLDVSSTPSATATDVPTATPDADSDCPYDEPSEGLSSAVSASATNNPSSASPSSASPSATTPVEANANATASPTSLGSGGYSGYY